MAKKANTKTIVCKPTVKPTIRYEDLENGDFFLDEDEILCVKCDCGDQEAMAIDDGCMGESCCGSEVTPVEVTITYKLPK